MPFDFFMAYMYIYIYTCITCMFNNKTFTGRLSQGIETTFLSSEVVKIPSLKFKLLVPFFNLIRGAFVHNVAEPSNSELWCLGLSNSGTVFSSILDLSFVVWSDEIC